METKRRKKVCADAVTVFFFGLLDYAFISEKLIRPFDHDVVRKGIPDGKFKNKDLVLALEQALDPNGLDFFFKPQKLETKNKKRKQLPHATNNTTATSTATPSAAPSTDTETNASTPSNQQEMPTKMITLKRPLDIDYDDSSNKKKRSKSPVVSVNEVKIPPIANVQPRPFSYTSKALEAACQKSPEYERAFKRVYVMRHKLQHLTYQKKQGEIPRTDYPAIDAILTDIEKYNMTKELLKETQIGKIVRFGCTYRFDRNSKYKLQERCLGILKTWATTLLDLSEHHPRQSPTKTKTTAPPPVEIVSFASMSSAASSSSSSGPSSIPKNGKAADNDVAPLVQQEDDSIDFRTAMRMVEPCPGDRKGKKKAIMVPVMNGSSNSKEKRTTQHVNGNFISPTVLPMATPHPINHNNRLQPTPTINRSEAITTTTTTTTPRKVGNQTKSDQKSSTRPLTNKDGPVSNFKVPSITPPPRSNTFDDNAAPTTFTPPTLPIDHTNVDVENEQPIDKDPALTSSTPPSQPIHHTNVDLKNDGPISNTLDKIAAPTTFIPPTLPNVDVENEQPTDKDETPPTSTQVSLPIDNNKNGTPMTSSRIAPIDHTNDIDEESEHPPSISTTRSMNDDISQVCVPEKPATMKENEPSSSTTTQHRPSSPPSPPLRLPTHFLYSLEARSTAAPTTVTVPQTSTKQGSPSSSTPVQLLTHFPYSLETCSSPAKRPSPITIPVTFNAASLGRKINSIGQVNDDKVAQKMISSGGGSQKKNISSSNASTNLLPSHLFGNQHHGQQ
ncbi:unnamed protein product [Absidia cylindrospora]